MYRKFGKRALDVLFALLALPFVGLAILLCAPLIFLTDRGPVFYNAPRRGLNGRVFNMFKLRTMQMNAPLLKNADGSAYSGDDDPRVTKVGRILRKLSVDELPQILNVLLGDMSFIGPRPTLPKGNYADFDDIRKKRLTVRPGITGYAQAYYRNSISQDEKFRLDCYYADNLSFALDVKILWQTVRSVLGRRNINYRESAQKKDVRQ